MSGGREGLRGGVDSRVVAVWGLSASERREGDGLSGGASASERGEGGIEGRGGHAGHSLSSMGASAREQGEGGRREWGGRSGRVTARGVCPLSD